MRLVRTMLAAGAVGLLIVGLLPGAAAANGPVAVATGLDNPRGIEIGSDGSIYVAESGKGGTDLVFASVEGQPSYVCLGNTGGITVIDKNGQRRLVDLPSGTGAVDLDGPGGPAEPTCDTTAEGFGTAATGPTDVAASGKGTLAVVLGLGGDAEIQEVAGEAFGSLHRVQPNGKVSMLANITAYEEAADPDGEGADSNPYGVALLDDGSRLVADAGANALFRVWPNGRVTTAAVFPRLFPPVPFEASCYSQLPPEFQAQLPPPGTPIPAQAVPTSVAVGPDGAWYVGTLSGFPFGVGNARIYRVDPSSGAVTTFASGLTHVTGIDFGPDGSLYAVEFQQQSLVEAEICGTPGPGALIRIKDGVQTKIADLPLPTDVAVAQDGSVYVTVFSILPGAGQVWKVAG